MLVCQAYHVITMITRALKKVDPRNLDIFEQKNAHPSNVRFNH